MTTFSRILVAGIGNIFFGDDAFGVEVVQRLARQERALPEGVRVVDFGIRGIDLAFALEACDAAILVDATSRGGAPGTLYVFEPVLLDLEDGPAEDLSTHAMTPERVLRWLAPETRPRVVRVVGCEPACLGDDDDDEGAMGLSEPVSAAVDGAIRLVEALLADLTREDRPDA